VPAISLAAQVTVFLTTSSLVGRDRPDVVALSRVYRGMHHPTDVVASLLVGATCALVAWNWLAPRDREANSPEPAVAGTSDR
jgi:hypothetical protein